MDLSDVKPENFFKLITYVGDPNPGSKKQIPLADFLLCAILLKLDDTLRRKL